MKKKVLKDDVGELHLTDDEHASFPIFEGIREGAFAIAQKNMRGPQDFGPAIAALSQVIGVVLASSVKPEHLDKVLKSDAMVTTISKNIELGVLNVIKGPQNGEKKETLQ